MKTLSLLAAGVSFSLLAGSVAAGPDFHTPTPRGTDLTASSARYDILPSDDIIFAFDSATIDDAGDSQIDSIARYLRLRRDVTVVIEGHADYVGSVDYNADLATRRANAVRSELIQRGIPSDRMVLAIFGEKGADPEGSPLDRRAVIYGTKTPVSNLVPVLLDKQLAMQVTWTRGRSVFTEENTAPRPKFVARR